MTRELRWPGSLVTIPAPRSAVAWAAESGFIYDPDKVDALIDDGRLVFHVSQPEPTADPDQAAGEPFVDGITGTPPVHAVIRIDRDIAHLRGRVDHLVRFAEETRRYVEDFHGRVIDVAEEAAQSLGSQFD
jgi:hypothetical protein